MMIIANPIYDIVFKYLMSDLDVAKGVIAAIIDEEILTLDFKSQEHVHKFKKTDLKAIKAREEDESDVDIKELIYYHLDFIAKIKMKTGGCKNVLIELQKTNLPPDIMRFRRYLGEQYKREDEVVDEEELVEERKERTVIREGLPIITIYFLGYKLSETLPGVIKVNREYIDVLGGGKIIEERSDFIECLTHNSYVIQVPSLHVELKTELERVLSVFQQENFIDETSRLKKYGYKVSDALLEMMLRQLQKAAGDAGLIKQLEEEENALHEFEYTYRALAREVKRKKKELEKKDKELDMSKKELDMSKKELSKKDKELDLHKKELSKHKKDLDENKRYIQELEERLREKGL
jgi:hypothetical protein